MKKIQRQFIFLKRVDSREIKIRNENMTQIDHAAVFLVFLWARLAVIKMAYTGL